MSSRTNAAAGWGHLVLVLLARAYRSMLLFLTVVAVAPLLVGAGSYVIKSGSMETQISVGDVTVARPYAQPEKVAVGRVYVFDDPATERTLVHRIVERRDDGDFTTAGDANPVTDATPLRADGIIARAILLVPFVGLPVAWAQAGQWLHVLAWLLLTIAAFVLAARDLDGEPPKWNLLRLLLGRRAPRGPQPLQTSARELVAHRASRAGTGLATAAGLGVAVLLGSTLGPANAAFTARTATASNTWQVGAWTQPYVTAVIDDRPHLFWMLDDTGPTWATDRSGNHHVGRFGAGVTFNQAGALPNNPGSSINTSTGVPLATQSAMGAPSAHTIELWLNTTSRTGGYLAGFESSATSNASTPAARADRILRMDTAGRITYGDWDTSPRRVITSPRAYNDGSWHHVVLVTQPSGSGSFGQSTLYVDGTPVASGQTSKVETFSGFLHVGGGSGGPAFTGRLDNVATYTATLSGARVAAHYAAR